MSQLKKTIYYYTGLRYNEEKLDLDIMKRNWRETGLRYNEEKLERNWT